MKRELIVSLAAFVTKHWYEKVPYRWKVGNAAWSSLQTGFDHNAFGTDLAAINVALRQHLAHRWASADESEKIRLANWIVSDWGGIRRNSKEKILSYAKLADLDRPSTPFEGVSSYSKILAVRDPERFAIFDARVAVSLNAIQLLIANAGLIETYQLLAFPIPQSRNSQVKRFTAAAFPSGLARRGFARLSKSAVYGTYLDLLRDVSSLSGKSVLELEMFLFAQAEDLGKRGEGLLG
ncbi:MAG: hypothetical protein ACOY4R_31450 [Pseudomonadota bacterium]